MKFRHDRSIPAIAIFVAATWSFAPGASAAPPLVSAESCTACHGPNGNSSGEIPSIAGKEPGDLIADLNAFRTGERTGSIMGRLVGGLTEAEIEAIANYFAFILEDE